ncbi:MAG: 5'-deoxynucleotidase [Coprococcus sp.]|nr:5'-deoxynucleotidase [Coprococcus sp.]
MEYNFYAMVSRMKYINRWALMRNTREENLCEHSLEVSVIAHALATIGNVRYDKKLNTEKAALIGLYHDASEIITGDMPTPIKYYNNELKTAFKDVEDIACHKLLDKLPADLRAAYEPILIKSEEDAYLWKLVKAADKLSAMIKCIEETASGNTEFSSALNATSKTLNKLADELPEVNDFMRDFLSSYGKTLDELSN